MRTAIYVKQSTTVTFQPSTQEAPTPLLSRYPDESKGRAATGSLPVEKGIYFIHSRLPVAVTGPHIEVEISIADKDEWPDPPAQVLALEPDATAEKVKMFFTIAKDLDL